MCCKRLLHETSSKNMLSRHDPNPSLEASVRALCYVTMLTGAVATVSPAPSSMQGRVCNLKVRICTFIAEHHQSFTISPVLVKLCKTLSEDRTALSRLTVSNAQVRYRSTHQFRQCLAQKLLKQTFSLNVDESTNQNIDRILRTCCEGLFLSDVRLYSTVY